MSLYYVFALNGRGEGVCWWNKVDMPSVCFPVDVVTVVVAVGHIVNPGQLPSMSSLRALEEPHAPESI